MCSLHRRSAGSRARLLRLARRHSRLANLGVFHSLPHRGQSHRLHLARWHTPLARPETRRKLDLERRRHPRLAVHRDQSRLTGSRILQGWTGSRASAGVHRPRRLQHPDGLVQSHPKKQKPRLEPLRGLRRFFRNCCESEHRRQNPQAPPRHLIPRRSHALLHANPRRHRHARRLPPRLPGIPRLHPPAQRRRETFL